MTHSVPCESITSLAATSRFRLHIPEELKPKSVIRLTELFAQYKNVKRKCLFLNQMYECLVIITDLLLHVSQVRKNKPELVSTAWRNSILKRLEFICSDLLVPR